MSLKSLPEERYYTEEHEWVQLIKDERGNFYIGITHYLEEDLGDIYEVVLEYDIGDVIEKGEVIGYIDSQNMESEFHMPVSGKIVQINEDLKDAPENINFEPYEEGWIIKVKIDSDNELDSLLSSEEYENEFGNDSEY
jgi:glycine cleavage system H protein